MKRGRKKGEHQFCYHFCEVCEAEGRSPDWFHELTPAQQRDADLDRWRRVCPQCQEHTDVVGMLDREARCNALRSEPALEEAEELEGDSVGQPVPSEDLPFAEPEDYLAVQQPYVANVVAMVPSDVYRNTLKAEKVS